MMLPGRSLGMKTAVFERLEAYKAVNPVEEPDFAGSSKSRMQLDRSDSVREKEVESTSLAEVE
jgi:hypothetical protein